MVGSEISVSEAYWCLTDEKLVEETSFCRCCGFRFDLCLCFVVVAVVLAAFAGLYLSCGFCNFVWFFITRSRRNAEPSTQTSTGEREGADVLSGEVEEDKAVEIVTLCACMSYVYGAQEIGCQ